MAGWLALDRRLRRRRQTSITSAALSLSLSISEINNKLTEERIQPQINSLARPSSRGGASGRVASFVFESKQANERAIGATYHGASQCDVMMLARGAQRHLEARQSNHLDLFLFTGWLAGWLTGVGQTKEATKRDQSHLSHWNHCHLALKRVPPPLATSTVESINFKQPQID